MDMGMLAGPSQHSSRATGKVSLRYRWSRQVWMESIVSFHWHCQGMTQVLVQVGQAGVHTMDGHGQADPA